MKYLFLIAIFITLFVACNNNNGSTTTTANADSTATKNTDSSDPHGWIGTNTIKSRLGDLSFNNGYPSADAVKKLNDAMLFNRAIEVYLDQMHAVSWYNVWKGITSTGPAAPNQLVIWEKLMDANTLLLTGNTETVYGLAGFDLKRDGPVVVEVPPMMLGGINDIWQSEIAGIGPTGADKGKGRKFLLLPPGYSGNIPKGYIVLKCTTFKIVLGVRGFLQDGKTDKAVALMKTTKVYPLSAASNPPSMALVDQSGKEINTIFSDDIHYFDDLAEIIQTEPADKTTTEEKFLLASIGIEKDKPFKPSDNARITLGEAAQSGSAYARVNSYASSDTARLVYHDSRWEWAFIGGSATWDSQGYVNTDRRAGFAYIAIGMSPAMVKKIVGGGSQYLWTPRDADGEFLDGAQNYSLHIPAHVPVKNFWSIVVYDASSRSMLRNGENFPSKSQYTGPQINADSSVDIYFGPTAPQGKDKNWIKMVPGKAGLLSCVFMVHWILSLIKAGSRGIS